MGAVHTRYYERDTKKKRAIEAVEL